MKVFQPKILEVCKHYSKKQLIDDLIAGLIVAIIALPLSIALAIATGVSPEKGLYTAIGSQTPAQGIAFALPVDDVVGLKDETPKKETKD